MKCIKCGFDVADGLSVCPSCGEKILTSKIIEPIIDNKDVSEADDNINSGVTETNINRSIKQTTNINVNHNYSQMTNNNNNNISNQSNKTYAIIAIVLGVIAFVGAFELTFLVYPFSIGAIILGLLSKRKPQGFIGVALGSLSLIVGIGMFVYDVVIYNPVAGHYNCTGVDSDRDSYLITLDLNKDKTFFYAPYGDTKNNYVKGKYTFKDERKATKDYKYHYYMINLKSDKDGFVVDGEKSDKEFVSEAEFGVTTGKNNKEGVILFTSSYNMYYCYQEK